MTCLSKKRFLEGDEMTCSMLFELADHLAMPVEDLVQFANVLSKKPNPVYNGQLEYYRGDEIPVEASAPEQLDQARTLLMEYLPEITKMTSANTHLPVQDEMTAGLRAMVDARRGIDGCPMYTIFATKLFLGVHGVLRVQHTQLFEELQATARRCVSTIDSYLRFSNNKQFTLWPAKNDAFLRQIKSIAQEWALEGRICKFKLPVEGGLEPEPFLFFKRNPIACGLLTFPPQPTASRRRTNFGRSLGLCSLSSPPLQCLPSERRTRA